MGYEIEFYKTENGHIPVEEFIKSLEAKFSAKIMRDIKLLKEFGSDLHKPYVDSIKGKKYKGLMELRTKQSSNIFRVFFFALVKDEKLKLKLQFSYMEFKRKLTKHQLKILKQH